MTAPLPARLDAAVLALPARYPGPGGAVAVLRAGEVLVRHAWGFADAEQRIPFTPRSLFRVCSITKQFTCALALDLCPDPSALDPAVRSALPGLADAVPSALHLMHNQSGLRDTWALAMLMGSPAEGAFGDRDTARLFAGLRSLQFAPGSRYSYANGNFRLLSDACEARAGRPFGDLLRERIFAPAGMATAFVAADTRALPDGTEGYEGHQAAGFRPAVNRIAWTGDAGLGMSLDDLVAWERAIDRARDDETSLYRRLSAPVAFADGAPSAYGFGLGRREAFGRAVTGHGGALRGWRSHRLHGAAERISVVVLFNHMADASAAALDLFAAVLGEERPVPATGTAPRAWAGAYLEPETRLAARVEPLPDGRLKLRYDRSVETLAARHDGSVGDEATSLRADPAGLRMVRTRDNQSTVLVPLAGEAARDLAGRYRCAELDAELLVEDAGGVLYGAFSGPFGQGRMEVLDAVAGDVWALPCPRALDHTPPGDWTLAFRRDGGTVTGATVGCWLARGLAYARTG